MDFLKFNAQKCSLCGICVEKCPFGALTMDDDGIKVSESCRMCGICVRQCPEEASKFEQKAKDFDQRQWKDIQIYVEQEQGVTNTGAYVLIVDTRKMAQDPV